MARSYIRNVGTGSIYNESGEIMAGQVIYVAGSAMPSGYLECNGATVSRTTYATLFAAIGSTYGAGDGTTTFALPDLRGEFLRGADRGRGVDSGRAVGSAQEATEISNYTHSDGAIQGATAAISTLIKNSDGNGPNFTDANATYYMQAANVYNGGSIYASSSKMRVRNVALIAAIKYS